MHFIFRSRFLFLFGLLFLYVKNINAQDSSAFYFTYGLHSHDFELINSLPFTVSQDVFQLNPAIYRSDQQGNHLINGMVTSIDYTWFDGVPVDFTEEMPIRLIGEVSYNDFTDYLKSGNSLTGFTKLVPVQPNDSLAFLVETSSRMIRKAFNDADLQLYLSGPLIRQASGNGDGPGVRFTLAGRLFSSGDTHPSYILRNQASTDYLDYLKSEPLRPSSYNGTDENAWFTHETDAVSSYFNSNAAKTGFSLFGNIRADFNHGISLKLGSYTVDKNERLPIYENYFFNQDNNPDQSTLYSTNYVLFGQRLESRGSTVFSYEVQGQYSMLKSKIEDKDLGDDFFNYGYAGKFDTYKSPTFEYGSDTVNGTFYEEAWLLNSWDYDTLVEFTPGDLNPGLAAYTSTYYSIFDGEPEGHYQNFDQIQLGGGLLNGQMPQSVYGLWNNAGTCYNRYSENDQRQLNISVSGSLVIAQQKIRHGFQFRRESYSSYQANPAGLWGLMRSLTNFHIQELDLDHPYVHEGDLLDTIYYPRYYDELSQKSFDKNLRVALGLDPEGVDFIDIDSYDYINNTISYFDKDGVKHTMDCRNDLFSLDMFSVDELLNDGISSYVSYSGYDHLGNRNRNNVSFEDFFNARDAEGEYIRPVGAYTPMNYSAYAGYKADFGGWSIDAGLRLDAFNANQQVLKDPYLFYEAYTAGELEDLPGNSVLPNGIGDGYVVYVDNGFNPTMVTGYRNGDQWYDAEGNKISDPNLLDVGSGIFPYLKYPGQERISASVFTKNRTYFNILPQVSLQKSFKERWLLSFRYNSAVSNPNPTVTFSNPVAYYFINNAAGWVPNGALKPERTDKFRAGLSIMPFRKMIISGEGFVDYYSNMIYLVRRAGAYPKDYFSYDNEDNAYAQYGFDIAFNGSSLKNSGLNYGISYHFIINKDNPSYLAYEYRIPKNLAKAYLQFNTGFGRNYLGPAGSVNYTIFSNLGMGLYGQFQSGIYYLPSRIPDGSGFLSGNSMETMPAQAFFDLKLEKGFYFNQDRYRLTLFCVIQNLLNTKVIYKVYRFTGEADDDGYLDAPESQKEISEAVDEESYRFLYASYINNPSNYGLPRRTTFGISFNF